MVAAEAKRRRSASGSRRTITRFWISRPRKIVETAESDRREGGGTSAAADADREVHVIRSPFIDKDSQEQFEIRTHKRLIDVLEPSGNTIGALMRLNLPAGVDIEIKL